MNALELGDAYETAHGRIVFENAANRNSKVSALVVADSSSQTAGGLKPSVISAQVSGTDEHGIYDAEVYNAVRATSKSTVINRVSRVDGKVFTSFPIVFRRGVKRTLRLGLASGVDAAQDLLYSSFRMYGVHSNGAYSNPLTINTDFTYQEVARDAGSVTVDVTLTGTSLGYLRDLAYTGYAVSETKSDVQTETLSERASRFPVKYPVSTYKVSGQATVGPDLQHFQDWADDAFTRYGSDSVRAKAKFVATDKSQALKLLGLEIGDKASLYTAGDTSIGIEAVYLIKSLSYEMLSHGHLTCEVSLGPLDVSESLPGLQGLVTNLQGAQDTADPQRKLVFSWTLPAVQIAGLEYRVKPVGGTYGAWTALDKAATSVTLSSLAPGSAREFEIRSKFSGGGVSQAQSAIAATRTGVPGPIDLSVFRSGYNTAASWTEPSYNGDASTYYQIRHGLSSSTNLGAWTTVHSRSRSLGGLANGMQRRFEARAVSSDGDPGPSDSVLFTPEYPYLGPASIISTTRVSLGRYRFRVSIAQPPAHVAPITFAVYMGLDRIGGEYAEVPALTLVSGTTYDTGVVNVYKDYAFGGGDGYPRSGDTGYFRILVYNIVDPAYVITRDLGWTYS